MRTKKLRIIPRPNNQTNNTGKPNYDPLPGLSGTEILNERSGIEYVNLDKTGLPGSEQATIHANDGVNALA